MALVNGLPSSSCTEPDKVQPDCKCRSRLVVVSSRSWVVTRLCAGSRAISTDLTFADGQSGGIPRGRCQRTRYLPLLSLQKLLKGLAECQTARDTPEAALPEGSKTVPVVVNVGRSQALILVSRSRIRISVFPAWASIPPPALRFM